MYSGAVHTRFVGLEDASDSEIYKYAKNHQLHIVTFDSDFADLSVIRGHPPKIIWLRTGNLTTLVAANIMVNNEAKIKSFVAAENIHHGVLELY